MKVLKSVKGCSKQDRFRKENIREELEIYKLNEKIELRRRNWKDHLQCMVDLRLLKAASNYKPAGRRSVGRPKKG